MVIYILITSGGNLIDMLPYFAVLGLAVQRLLPLFQQIYYSFAHIESDYATLVEVADNCNLVSKESEILKSGNLFNKFDSINFINVSYTLNKKEILKNINLNIKKGKKLVLWAILEVAKVLL